MHLPAVAATPVPDPGLTMSLHRDPRDGQAKLVQLVGDRQVRVNTVTPEGQGIGLSYLDGKGSKFDLTV